jgi:Protein of unknown function (DUF1360)
MKWQFDEPLLFLVSVLATWRITALVAYESGPFRILERLRRLLVVIRLGRLVSCFHCLGLWIAAGVALIVYRWDLATLLVWLGLAGAVSIIERWLDGGTSTGDSEDGV